MGDDGDPSDAKGAVVKVVYLAHPLRGTDRAENLRRARAWFRWALTKGVAVVMDWLLLAEELPDDDEIWERYCMELVERADEVWLVGGRVSEGMAIERAHAEIHGVRVRDLTDLGAEPPIAAVAKAG
jgi:hypothetical protein